LVNYQKTALHEATTNLTEKTRLDECTHKWNSKALATRKEQSKDTYPSE